MLKVDFPDSEGPLAADPCPEALDAVLAHLASDDATDPGAMVDLEVTDLVWEIERAALRTELADEAAGWAKMTGAREWAPDRVDEALLRERVLAVLDPCPSGAAGADGILEAAPTVDLGGLSDARLAATVASAERAVRYQLAWGLRASAELARRRPASSGGSGEQGLSAYALDELSVAAGIPRGAMAYRLAEAVELTGRLPKVLDAMQAGLLSPQAVRTIAAAIRPLDEDKARTVEVELLDRVGARTHPSLARLGSMPLDELLSLSDETVGAVSLRATSTLVGRLAKDLVRRADPAAAARRKGLARVDRSVRHTPGEDEMGWLSVYGPQVATAAAMEYVDALARALPDDPADDRSLDARRADVALDLLRGLGQPAGAAPVPTVSLDLLIDHTRCPEPGSSRGPEAGGGCVGESGRLGLVSAGTAAELLGLVESSGGTVTGGHATWSDCPGEDVHDAIGPGPYVPLQGLKRQVRAHWRRCCFPGCARPARRCHLDHTVPHPEGPTCICNLEPLCTHHHQLKHDRPPGRPGWRLVNDTGRSLTWTTPTGRDIRVWPDPPDPPPQPSSREEPPPY